MWKLEHTVRGAARGWELTVNFDGNEIVCDGTKLDALVLAYETLRMTGYEPAVLTYGFLNLLDVYFYGYILN